MAAILPTVHFLIMAVYALLVSASSPSSEGRCPGRLRLFGILLGRSPCSAASPSVVDGSPFPR